jgi:hypothetical protein
MDAAKIARLSTSIAETGNRQEVGIAVLKKAQQIQGAAAAQMVEALKETSAANLPPHLGNKVNTTA